MSLLRIATRKSELAMTQARQVAGLLRTSQPDLTVELVGISTRGDRDADPLLWRRSQTGGVGFFVAEVERALLDGTCDVAVHSLKDMPTADTPGLTIAATPHRVDPRDVLVFPRDRQTDIPMCDAATTQDVAHDTPAAVAAVRHLIDSLPPGTRVGTASPRREQQILQLRSDFIVTPVRGNVGTRLAKLDAGEYDLLILAAAGLSRLRLSDHPLVALPVSLMVPAPGQGALGVQCRTDDPTARPLLEALNDPHTLVCVTAERAFLAAVEGGCRLPVGAFASWDGRSLTLSVFVGQLDDEPNASGTPADATATQRASTPAPSDDAHAFAQFTGAVTSADQAAAWGRAVGERLRGTLHS